MTGIPGCDGEKAVPLGAPETTAVEEIVSMECVVETEETEDLEGGETSDLVVILVISVTPTTRFK